MQDVAMACHGILDKRMCETSTDRLGACTWSGSEISGYCKGAQNSAVPEATATPPAADPPEAYDLAVMLPMYLWAFLTLVVIGVVLTVLFRAERNCPTGPRPDEKTIKAAMRSR